MASLVNRDKFEAQLKDEYDQQCGSNRAIRSRKHLEKVKKNSER